MVRVNNSAQYQPLITAGDRLAQRPIKQWRATLVRTLGEELVKPRMESLKLAGFLNQLALLEAYQGNTQGALAACEAQIRFWKASAQLSGHASSLNLVVQPWVNIVRLERWNKNLVRSTALYRELGPAHRSDLGSLQTRYGVEPTFDELDQLDPSAGIAALLDVVYWREYGILLFNTAEGADLQRHLQAGVLQANRFLQVVMLEILLAYQVNLGHYTAALSFLQRLPLSASMVHWLPFKALEMYVAQRVGSADFTSLVMTVADAALSIEHDERGLVMLVDISRLFGRMDMHAEELALLQAAQHIAHELNDEVLLFEVMHRLSLLGQDIGCDLQEKFAASSYAVVRKKIGLGIQSPNEGPDVVRAIQSLATRDIESCLIHLGCMPFRGVAADVV
jgi:tetratricopeptide (TPR) repeat protein